MLHLVGQLLNKKNTVKHSVNGKVVTVFNKVTSKEGIVETELYLHRFLFSALRRGEQSASRHSRFVPAITDHVTLGVSGWVSSKTSLEAQKENFFLLPIIRPLFVYCTDAGRHCTECAIYSELCLLTGLFQFT